MRRILLAVDLDEHAASVIAVTQAAAGTDASYRVVHAFRPPASAALAGFSSSHDRSSALAALRERAGTIVGAEHKLLDGEPSEAILDEARSWRADTIALAPRSHSRIERLLLGSMSARILRHAPMNVLLARAPTRRFARVLVCTDLHAPSRAAADVARRIAEHGGADLTALFAAHPAFWGPKAEAPWPPDALDMDADWLDRAQQEAVHAWLRAKVHDFNDKHLGGKAREAVIEGNPPDVILKEAQSHDLVVLGTHGPTPYERAVIGSVAETVATRAPTSVLVVKAQRERI